LNAYRTAQGAKICFLKEHARAPPKAELLRLPCGQCIGCRLDRSREWATRLMHEARSHEETCFITLTYDESNLPQGATLVKEHFTLFMKRLRQYAARNGFGKIRFFHCGEYGDEFKRPHYHALLYGIDFPDRRLWTVRDSHRIDSSDILDSIWGKGFTTVANLTWESAAYVARYALKKKHGNHALIPDEKTGLLPYERLCPITLTVAEVEPEYATMSNRPGIGADYFHRFGSDIYPLDEVIVNSHPTKPPRYYDKLFEIDNPEAMEEIREQRNDAREQYAHDNTRARLRAKEAVKTAQVEQLKRGLT
jgi:hypothetical protein